MTFERAKLTTPKNQTQTQAAPTATAAPRQKQQREHPNQQQGQLPTTNPTRKIAKSDETRTTQTARQHRASKATRAKGQRQGRQQRQKPDGQNEHERARKRTPPPLLKKQQHRAKTAPPKERHGRTLRTPQNQQEGQHPRHGQVQPPPQTADQQNRKNEKSQALDNPRTRQPRHQTANPTAKEHRPPHPRRPARMTGRQAGNGNGQTRDGDGNPQAHRPATGKTGSGGNRRKRGNSHKTGKGAGRTTEREAAQPARPKRGKGEGTNGEKIVLFFHYFYQSDPRKEQSRGKKKVFELALIVPETPPKDKGETDQNQRETGDKAARKTAVCRAKPADRRRQNPTPKKKTCLTRLVGFYLFPRGYSV